MQISSTVGLCATCQHMKLVTSAKGSHFILCGLAKTDKRFSKYPPLPIIECVGYRPQRPAAPSQSDPQ